MGMKIKVDLRQFREALHAKAEELNGATRPAAQAGAQIIYDRARQLVPVSKKEHKFYGANAVYGPYAPGTLRDSIYQVFSEDNSYRDVSTYHISWNAAKAPYGAMVELGTSRTPAHPFIGSAVTGTKRQVIEAMKARYIEKVTGK